MNANTSRQRLASLSNRLRGLLCFLRPRFLVWVAAGLARVIRGKILALRQAGVKRKHGAVVVRRRVEEEPKRYGYRDEHRRQEPEQLYPSCLTQTEWELVADLFEQPGKRGRPPQYSRWEMVNACCYVVRNGCSWRMLPHEFPPWENVYRTFRRWAAGGKFEQMHDRLRELWRSREERAPEPSAAVLDAQSTRSSPQGGPSGYDAGKKVKGRKRNLVVDTLGLLLMVSVVPANVQDRDGADHVVRGRQVSESGEAVCR